MSHSTPSGRSWPFLEGAVRVEQAKRSAETRTSLSSLVGVGKWPQHQATISKIKRLCVVDVPVRTYLLLSYLNFTFFETRRHPMIPIISRA